MKTQIILVGLSLLFAVPTFASDRGPQPDVARRSSQVQRPGTAEAIPAMPTPHDHAAMTEHQAKNGAGMCGCSAMKHNHS
jgi:hypothetical protein